jgi:membrane-bound serine protease (ClpP class)
MRRLYIPFILLIVLLLVPGALAQPPAAGPLYRATVSGTLTAVSTGYLQRALHLAEAANASALIIELSNSGAVLSEARAFAGEIAAAKVPVVVYITQGTESGAAGALFLSAAQIAAVAPGSSFGSPSPLTQVDAALSQQTRDMLLDGVARQLRDWNAAHGRNTAWIEQAVRAGVVLNNQQASALRPPAVDLVAASSAELLTLLEGRQISLLDGRTVTIAALGRTVVEVSPTAWESLRLALADPTLAFVLLVLGVIAIGLEFAAPGTSLFAGIGVVLLLAAGLGLVVLPLRLWALGLLVLALALMAGEFVAHTHGALAIAGMALMTVSALNIIDPAQAPGTFIAVWAIVLVGLALATFVALAVWLALRSRQRPVTTGQEAMVGKLAEVRQRLAPDGMVFIDGALWQAIVDGEAAEPGEWVRVVSVHNLHLVVRHLDAPAPVA